MVPIQLTCQQDRSEPTSPRSRSGPGPWIPTCWVICKGWSIKKHTLCRRAGSLAAAGFEVILYHVFDYLWDFIFQRRRAINCTIFNIDWQEKGARPIANSREMAKFTGGFFFGGVSGVTWAYFLLYVLDLPYYVK